MPCAFNQMGVMLAARNYDFKADAPFKTSDILDLQSVVKHLSPVCIDAHDLLESGKLRLAEVSNKNMSTIGWLCFLSTNFLFCFLYYEEMMFVSLGCLQILLSEIL